MLKKKVIKCQGNFFYFLLDKKGKIENINIEEKEMKTQ